MKNSIVNENSAPIKKGDIIGCDICGHIATLEKFDEDKMEITYFCSKCDKIKGQKTKVMNLKDYLKSMNYYSQKFNICSICSKMSQEKDLKFCTNCEIIVCQNCIKKHINNLKCTEESLMNNCDKNIKCLKHHKEVGNFNTHFCKTHQIHYCDSCMKKLSNKEKHNKKNGCETEELLNLYIGDNEKLLFKAKVEEIKNKKDKLLDEINKKKNTLTKNLEETIKEINSKKDGEIRDIENKQKKEEEENKRILEEEKTKIEEEYERKFKELEAQKNEDISLSEQNYESKNVEIDKKVKKEIEDKKDKYDRQIKEKEAKYKEEIDQLDNDEKMDNLNDETEFLEQIERAYDKNKKNYYNINNYLFVVNGFKNDETPNPNNEEKEVNINLNINVKHNNMVDNKNDIINSIKDEERKINILNESLEMENTNFSSFPLLSRQPIINDVTIQSEPYNIFEVIESNNEQLCILYVNNKNSIIAFNLTKQTKEEVEKISDESIDISLRYYCDNTCKVIISNLSNKDKTKTNIKVWKFGKWNETIANSTTNYCCSCYCVKNDKNSKNLFTFDSNNFCKWLKENDFSSFFYVDSYYDNENNIYLIGAGKNCIKSINNKSKKLYKTYYDIILENEKDNYYTSIEVYEKEKSTFLSGLMFKSKYIRIWNFHKGEIVYKIKIESPITSFCLWNNNYLFAGCEDKTIKIYSIEEGEKKDELQGYSSCIMGLKKLKIGEQNMLFSQEKNGKIFQHIFN